VMGLQAILPDVTKRTIRRDLDELIRLGRVVRTGDYNGVSYQLK
jgi:DeoR/GlpR family transcriptional regulator of sugar metabolism